ncbi:MAG: MBL fold metallo-hydrolase [Sideroxyarcus sp.]|nr:MBL fold metallo-hydrolase [Sideroxyarcus sp.]
MIKHYRQQWAVGHGFFHSGKIETDTASYRYVYDCGSHHSNHLANKRVNELYGIESLDSDKPSIDMVVISHFHADHINGVPRLFQQFKIRQLVLPFLSEDSQIVALAQLAATSPNAWNELHELVTNPRGWVNQHNGEETLIVQISENAGEVEVHRENDDGLFIGPPGIVNHNSTSGICQSQKVIWNFKFFIQNNSSASQSVIQKLQSSLSIPSRQILLDNLKNETWIKNNWDTIKKCYTGLGSSKQNATTLCMFSGPAGDYQLHDARISGKPLCYFQDCWWIHLHYGIGWLGTGDAELKSKTNFQAFMNHFNGHIEKTSTTSIPHHGSINNYHPKLGEIGFRHTITSDYAVDPKGHHPSPTVVSDIQAKCGTPIIVTKSSHFSERFFLEINAGSNLKCGA